jgi:hypothetical protein
MARKITSGKVGRAVLGNLSTLDNRLQSVVTNENLLLDPNGTGIVQSTKDLQINAQNSLRLGDGDSSNWIALRSPATVAANVTLTFPATAGTSTQVLTTDGTGVLSWASAGLSVANQTADTTTYYPTLITTTSGTTGSVTVSNTKLSFVPSTGILSTTGVSVTSITATGTVGLGSSVTITGGNINGTTIGGTTAAAGTFTTMTATSIVETSSIALKENVSPITGALDAIMQLVGVTYDRKDGSSKNEAGLIKEEVEKILPNLVKDDGIHYTKLTAYLIEAVKELTAEINELKSKRN